MRVELEEKQQQREMELALKMSMMGDSNDEEMDEVVGIVTTEEF